ncbi:hypothetical protein ACFFLS_18310 [Flavobacterium procerum]|uniref:Lipoprotein n=1 Tax=Flavobacterium procerum TaxID=1455569 RepID=A0ABV6BU95_9FLAO
MINNFRLNLRNRNSILFVFTIILFGCQRIEKTAENEEYPGKKLEISPKEIQRILNTKANLESVEVSDNLKFSIPENYYFETSTIKKEDIEGADIKYGKLDLTTKDSYDVVQIVNALFNENKISEENIIVVKDENPNLVTIDDLKEQYKIDAIYFEDKNSIVFSEGKTFTTLHFQYDFKIKSYLIYSGSISWTKEFPNADKLNLAFYFLRNAKNLLSDNLTKQEFTWKDYLDNSPQIEINLMKFYFKDFKKEMDVFLEVNETSSPVYDGISLLTLCRIPSNGDTLFYQFLNNIETGNYEEANNFKWANGLIFRQVRYKIIPKGNSTVLEINQLNYEGEVFDKQFVVLTIMNHNKKTFLLKKAKIMNEKIADFYVKMFNYYVENLTLDVVNKK